MATLGNLLARKGGTPCTGKEVTLALAIPDPQGGPPRMEDATVLLLPVGHATRSRAFRAADLWVAEQLAAERESGTPGAAHDLAEERVFRLMLEAMRDPAEARRRFVSADDVDTFREIIAFEQLQALDRAYSELLREEYPETLTKADLEAMKKGAETFTSGTPAQP
jgi:hypothetical protein